MIFGNYPATVDPKGRLKIPTAVRSYFEETYGPDFFVTSIDGGQSVRVYPLSVWKEIAEKLASPPSFNKASFSAISFHTDRSEEHTSELQSRLHLVCRLLLEKKK